MVIGEEVPSIFSNPGMMDDIPTEAIIRLAENGFKMRYGGKDFIADSVDEMLKTVEKWFRDSIKEKDLKIK